MFRKFTIIWKVFYDDNYRPNRYVLAKELKMAPSLVTTIKLLHNLPFLFVVIGNQLVLLDQEVILEYITGVA